MGYYVNITEAEWTLPAHNCAEALQRLKDLNKPENDHLKRGGSFGPDGKREAWFSWMPPDYDKTATSVPEVLELLGFDVSVVENGDVFIGGYDNKSGQEELFLQEIADLVMPGSYIVWRGEDGEMWRDGFDGSATPRRLSAKIVWE